MIILGDDEAQLPKLTTPSPVYSQPVNRCTTPTYSLPDYETSEAQHQDDGKWKTKPRNYRRWRLVLICLLVYSLLTLIIGVPLLVVKLRHDKHPTDFISSQWSPQQASVVLPGQEIVSSPPSLQDAKACDVWIDGGHPHAGWYSSTLNYTLSPIQGIFLGSNGSYKADGTSAPPVAGYLLVDMNDDPSVTNVLVTVAMSYTDPDIRNNTHVCMVDIYDSDGVYIYVPKYLAKSEKLSFNITLLFPQPRPGTALNISSLATMLPNFKQDYGDLSPSMYFEQATLGGPMSTVTVGSIAADNLVVMSSPGEIRGSFEASCQLVLETMSAAITANVTMRSSYDNAQPTIRLNTGNQPLNANVTLITINSSSSKSRSKSGPPPPTFYIDANTFNSQLSLSVIQDPLPSTISPVFIHAGNNLGEVDVTLDEYFQRTCPAQMQYATAVVRDNGLESSSAFVSTSDDSFTRDFAGRSLYFDSIQDSIVSGWVGDGERPSLSDSGIGAPGCVEVLSVLSPVSLNLGLSSDSS